MEHDYEIKLAAADWGDLSEKNRCQLIDKSSSINGSKGSMSLVYCAVSYIVMYVMNGSIFVCNFL